ncbi:hypothetical protein FPV33_03625 [Klebsiella aerogenes]|nr:hypothetical protein AM407_08880 [Klebsiella aerogenes]KAA0474039.1 hypothetical protein F0333_01195 [Klebsiella aerogenes]QDR54441.1 hypothetical protein FPV33_03625 [Klebsiella aerogenes]RNT20030.1 hypothetical protein B9Z99_005605 [Klebsiella aerogenes]TSI57199.1 hypothetical protein FPI68_08195 [Klebsiella aerogenes]
MVIFPFKISCLKNKYCVFAWRKWPGGGANPLHHYFILRY